MTKSMTYASTSHVLIQWLYLAAKGCKTYLYLLLGHEQSEYDSRQSLQIAGANGTVGWRAQRPVIQQEIRTGS